MKRLIFILFFILLALQIKSQTSSYSKRNAIKLNATAIPSFNVSYSIDYEYNILNFSFIKFNVEASVGQYFQLVNFRNHCCFHTIADCWSFTGAVNSLLGKKSHYLELITGIRYSLIDKQYANLYDWLPILNIGYRYQNFKCKGLIFRTFVGTSGIGVSIGKRF